MHTFERENLKPIKTGMENIETIRITKSNNFEVLQLDYEWPFRDV